MHAHNETIERIARQMLGIDTLDTRHLDRLDIHDLPVWAIRQALERAYEAGRRAAPPTRATCPACGRDIEIRPL